MESHVLAVLVFERYVRYFGSLHTAFGMSCDTEYLKNCFCFFGKVVSFVLYCVELWWFSHKPSEKHWAFSPKAKHKISKRRWVRSKNVFLSAALLFSLVVTKENCFENFLRSLYLEQYVFFAQMQSRVLAALVFERFVRYFGSLHPAFEMSCDTEY